ncbi:MAG: T9SS type A sorting domain-containing protein, partial [Bacteroidales bacterium]|nr:T9SS type A sorting domain-containing protein [Bacteroidales bacterium]
HSTGIDSRLMNSVSLYPNPATNHVDVLVSDNSVNVSRLEVYDVYGKLLNEVEVVDNPTRIDVSSLASGVYFVKVITGEGVTTKTFVKK